MQFTTLLSVLSIVTGLAAAAPGGGDNGHQNPPPPHHNNHCYYANNGRDGHKQWCCNKDNNREWDSHHGCCRNEVKCYHWHNGRNWQWECCPENQWDWTRQCPSSFAGEWDKQHHHH